MAIQHTVVNHENQFLVSCPSCMQIIRMNVADLNDTDRIFKVFGLQSVYICQCQCGNKFNLKLDLRRKTRRNVKLPAYFAELATSGHNDKFTYQYENTYGKKPNCEIKDLSVEGIRIKATIKHNVQIGDTLLIKFDLGGEGVNRIVEKKVKVHSVKMDLFGCEFFQKDKNDARIGFYLL